jgi:hypothetical protein
MLVLNKFYLSCFLSSIVNKKQIFNYIIIFIDFYFINKKKKGDRLWYFALSMYFVTINDNNLLMTVKI